MVSASTEDRSASKDLEAQSGWLFVGLERWIDDDRRLNLNPGCVC
jgi:hypothetical protein